MARNKFTKEVHLMKMGQARIEPVQQPMGAMGVQPGGVPDIQQLKAIVQRKKAEVSGQVEGAV